MGQDKVLRGPDNHSIPEDTFGHYLFKKLEEHDRSKTLLIDCATKKQVTSGEIQDNCKKLARILTNDGIKQGDVISVVSENSLSCIIPVIAGLYIGATINPLNPSYIPRELKHAFTLSKPKLVFCSKTSLRNVLEAKLGCDFIERILLIEGQDEDEIPTLEELLEIDCGDLTSFKPEAIDSTDQVAVILSSSGTSGLPKGVMITYENLRWHLTYMFDFKYMGLSPNSVILQLVPFFHIFGLFLQLFSMSCASKLLIMNAFKPENFLRNLDVFRVTKLFIVPPVGIFLAKSPLVDNYNLTSIKDVVCGAAPIGQDIVDILEQRLQVKVRQIYGLTEIGALAIVNQETMRKPGSTGLLIPNLTVKICHVETRECLGPGEHGEICVKGPTVVKGYIRNVEATKSAFDKDGFLVTGDIGYYDEDGYLYIVDRLKELIKYKGFQVAPIEIETILLTHEAVQEVAVIGIPDERAGELPMAVVVKRPDIVVTIEELLDFVAERVSIQKRLHGGIKFVKDIPKNNGKILKRILRDLYLENKL